MIKEAIILAGGFGTRWRSVITDLPKPMAPVNGKPFLHYVLLRLSNAGIEKAVLSFGYLSEKIEDYFGSEYLGIKIFYAHEKEALGTGGGIRLAMEQCRDAHVLAMNGDSFLQCDLEELCEKHLGGSSDATLALRQVEDASRYGTVQLDGSHITAFREKSPDITGKAWINGGVYVLRKKTFLGLTEPKKAFSIEFDFFAKYADKLWLQGVPTDGYFIDIGVPEDYERAQKELPAHVPAP